MNTRQLGVNGPQLTEIGFGAWAIGGSWQYGWGKVDDSESIAAIHNALDLGINWIDTAAQYGLGHSEEVVGRALRGRRDKVFIATKCSQLWDDMGRMWTTLKPDSIRKECEESLRRLGTEYIDLYQIHWPDPDIPVEESWTAMVRLKAEGKVRFIGVCNYGVEQLERCETVAHIQSLQPIYNMLERDVEHGILQYCASHGVGVVAYSPMQSGLLSGSFDIKRLATDDWRHNSDKFKEPKYSRGIRLVEQLRTIARKYGKSTGQLAVAWVLMNDAVTSAIVGARRPEQVEQDTGGSGWKLSAEDMAKIEQMLYLL